MKTIFNIFYVIGWVAGASVFVGGAVLILLTFVLALAATANWMFT